MLAWTELAYNQDEIIAEIIDYAKTIQDKFDNFVVLGIGGSALGPIALQQALNHMRYNDLSKDVRKGPRFFVEDNVDPERMKALLDVIDIKKTCFNVISKSGSTSETMSQYLIISTLLKEALGKDWAENVVATTDSKKGNLIKIAQKEGIKTFYIPDGVGGRFSEICPVGLFPAAVCSIDIEELLAGVAYMDELSKEEDIYKNASHMAGLLMYIAMEQKGKNIQVVMPYADSLKYMADWHAQLWAESLGKKHSLDGKTVHVGQTPVKAVGVTDQHSQVQLFAEGPFDKVITFIGVDNYRTEYTIPNGCEDVPDVAFLGGHTLNELIQSEYDATEYALTVQGKLNQRITLPEVNAFTIGQLMYFFMMQTAVAGELLNIDAFDQPGVEAGKNATYALLGKAGYEDHKKELDARPEKSSDFIL
jgi:glucose-6-phosphate isomerase